MKGKIRFSNAKKTVKPEQVVILPVRKQLTEKELTMDQRRNTISEGVIKLLPKAVPTDISTLDVVSTPARTQYWVYDVYDSSQKVIVKKYDTNDYFRVSYTLNPDGTVASIGALIPVMQAWVDKE